MTNKDLISQYVDTGLMLPEYQVNKLRDADKRTYLRKRLISIDINGGQLEVYEFVLFDDKAKWEYYVQNQKNNSFISSGYLDVTPYTMKLELIKLYIDKESIIAENLFNMAPIELKRKWLNLTINKNRQIYSKWLEFMSDELMAKLVEIGVNNKIKYNDMIIINSSIYNKLPETLKLKIVNAFITKENTYMIDSMWDKTPISLQKHFVRNLAVGDYNIDPYFYEELSDEVKFEYLKYNIEHLKKIRGDSWDTFLSDYRHNDYNRLKHI